MAGAQEGEDWTFGVVVKTRRHGIHPSYAFYLLCDLGKSLHLSEPVKWKSAWYVQGFREADVTTSLRLAACCLAQGAL